MKMKRTLAAIAALTMFCSVMPAAPTVFAAESASQKPVTAAELKNESGRMVITEAGEYTLTGKMTGTLVIDAADGDVSIILDNADLNGKDGAAIEQLGGNLTLSAKPGTSNIIRGKGTAVKCAGSITVKSGSFRIYSDGSAFDCKELTISGGSISVSAKQLASDATDLVKSSGKVYYTDNSSAESTVNASAVTSAQTSDTSYVPVQVSGSTDTNSQNSEEPAFIPSAPTETKTETKAETVTETKTETQHSEETKENNPIETAVISVLSSAQTEEKESGSKSASAASETAVSDNGNEQKNGSSVSSAANQELSDGQTPPEFPGGQNNAGTFSRTQFSRDNTDGQTPPDMNGGQMFGGMQNSSEAVSTVDEPTTIAKGTTENSAMSLTADYDNAATYNVSEDSTVKITESGTYVVTGTSSDGSITVKKGTTGVILVLDDLDLTSTSGATLSINKEAEVQVIISGNVTLTDNENPEDENSEDAEVADAFDGAAIKVKADSVVFITGDGTLNINGNAKNGIKGGDNSSVIIGGDVTVNIKAANDGINGNYDVAILDGTVNISAGDDAVHADRILTVGNDDGTGPDITVTNCEEGLEGTVVNVKGGNITVKSNDDGINAANSDGTYSDELDFSINVTGGNINITAGTDGLDSNGNINLVGGSATISSANNGGDAGIDYDGEFYISDDFKLNNNSGVAGPDNMPGGGFPGGDMNGNSTGGQNGSFPGGDMNGNNAGGQNGGGFPGGNMTPAN